MALGVVASNGGSGGTSGKQQLKGWLEETPGTPNFPVDPITGFVKNTVGGLVPGSQPPVQPAPNPLTQFQPFGATFQTAVNNQQQKHLANQYATNTQNNLDFLTAFNSPTLAAMQAQQERGGLDIAGLLANQSTQTGVLNNNAALDRQRLDLKRQGIGTEADAADRQGRNADAAYAIAQQLFGNTTAGLTHGADVERRAAESSATARGAMHAPGIGRIRLDISTRLMNQVERAQLGLDQEKLSRDETKAQARDKKKNLDLLSKGIGLDAKQIENNLESALSTLGLNTFMSVTDVTDMIASQDVAMNQLGIQILTQALGMGGIALDPSMLGAMGIGLPAPTTAPSVPGAGGKLSPEDRGAR